MTVQPLRTNAIEWQALSDVPLVGKDVIELLTSSMYVNPLSIYREYIQNAADSIDAGREIGLPSDHVDIVVDPRMRKIRIRDDGTGIAARDFDARLTTVGASEKRLRSARGFRGVGRLAGLGYCQTLTFRSRAAGENVVREMRWDCRRLKTLLNTNDYDGNLSDLLREVVAVRGIRSDEYPAHFFEVELEAVIRHRNDALLDSTVVAAYLSEVAPVPFSADFCFRSRIADALQPYVPLPDIHITINDALEVLRPHRDELPARGGSDAFNDMEVFQLPGDDGAVAAVGWVLHHGYRGALPPNSGIGGLRVRCGNMQIGEGSLLDLIFPEPRFNAWSVGEFHVVDRRIIPNGRRDHFETNRHFSNLINQLTPVARSIVARCRTSSLYRKWQRDFEDCVRTASRNLAIARQNVASEQMIEESRAAVAAAIEKMANIVRREQLNDALRRDMSKRLTAIRRRAALPSKQPAGLRKLRFDQRPIYSRCFELIYECSEDPLKAKVLIDKMIRKLARRS